MNTRIDRDFIESALDNAGLTWNDLGDSYSGRGMSFILEGKRVQRDICRFFVWLTNDLTENLDGLDVANALADAVSTDDLGLDTIVYFPGWSLS